MPLTRISQNELDAVVFKHTMFREARVGGTRAILSYHDLSGLDLSGRDLSHADFTGAVLCQCNLRDTKLDYAIFV